MRRRKRSCYDLVFWHRHSPGIIWDDTVGIDSYSMIVVLVKDVVVVVINVVVVVVSSPVGIVIVCYSNQPYAFIIV